MLIALGPGSLSREHTAGLQLVTFVISSLQKVVDGDIPRIEGSMVLKKDGLHRRNIRQISRGKMSKV